MKTVAQNCRNVRELHGRVAGHRGGERVFCQSPSDTLRRSRMFQRYDARFDTPPRWRDDDRMSRGLMLALLCLAWPAFAGGQDAGVLRIRVVLRGADDTPTPIRRHLLLISDNPASAPPRRVVTDAEGLAQLRLRPGNYTVESDQPVAFGGRIYQWTETVDLVAGGDRLLELTAANAVDADTGADPLATGFDRATLAARWQDSVVEVWSPTAHASGTLLAEGLVVTNHYALGRASIVEVQLSRTRKVAGLVLFSDAERDVAVLRIAVDAATAPPVPLDCAVAAPAAAVGDEIVAIEAPLLQPKGANRGTVRRVASRVIESDLTSGLAGAGGPVFSLQGTFLGITSEGDARMRASGDGDIRVVRASDLCAAITAARASPAFAAALDGAALPVEPTTPFPTASVEDPATLLARHPPPQLVSDTFDIAFLTPLHVVAGQEQRRAAAGRTTRADATWLRARLAIDFANWADYVSEVPPLVFVRITPKLVESFWMKVARGAAYTQGVALPPLKRLTSGFLRLRAFCGPREVTPVHPFVLEIEGVGDESVAEGLYAFDPDALTPGCGPVRLELYAQKAAARAEVVVVDPSVLTQVAADFTAWRARP